MEYMKPAKQAQALYEKVRETIRAFNSRDEFLKNITETEVVFRYRTIEGFLLMAMNEVGTMMRQWMQDEQEAAVQHLTSASPSGEPAATK